MEQEKALDKLLNDIIEDNETYQFPIMEIELEVTALFLDKKNYKHHLKEIMDKLKKDYSVVVSKIFLRLFLAKFDIEKIEEMSMQEYCEKVEELIAQLYRIRITIVPKDSDDYDLMNLM